MYFARTEVVLSEDILNFNIKIEEYVDVDEKIYFLFQPIIYFYVFNGELVAYGGNIGYLNILNNIISYSDEIRKKILKKTIICCIINIDDEKEKYRFHYMRLLCLKGESIGMSNSELIESIKDEDLKYSNDDLYNISSWGADLSFRELGMMYEEEELLKPELQRKYVWTKNEASRFIDSILLGLPIPSIFLAKEKDEKKLIIDGYQRIMTVYDFTKGIFSDSKKVFKLSNSEIINPKWRGKTFAELTSDEQRRIKSTTIHAIIFEQKHPNNDTGMYQVFERINTSGKVLRPQEIRNCVYQGSFNSMLFELNKDENWRYILKKQEDNRMYDLELILRFFALRDLDNRGDVKQINLVKYLNEYMGDNRDLGEESTLQLKEDFKNVIKLYKDHLGQNAFRNYLFDKEKYATKVNPAIFDSLCIAADRAIKNNIIIDDDLENKYKKLLNDEGFISVITQRTTDIKNIKQRISLAYKYLFGDNNE